MSSPRKDKKNLGFERTRSSRSHHHRSSKDSGVGSSSASDRASLGTAPDAPFTYQQVEDQRQILGAVQEALDAANERIRQLEAANAKLNTQLFDSNKENRLLKREKGELLNKLDAAADRLDQRDKTIRSLAQEPSSPPPRRGEKSSSTSTSSARARSSHRDERRSSTSGRRYSLRGDVPGSVPLYDSSSSSSRPPPASPNTTPNPFAPRGAPLPTATYRVPGAVAYAANGLSYAPVPTFGHPTSPVRERAPNDGKYYLTPL